MHGALQPTTIMENTLMNLENLYDTYSPMLLSMALEISNSRQDAEEILVQTFLKISRLKILDQYHVTLSGKLLKILIQTAKEFVNPQNNSSNFKLKQFEKVPITQQLLFEQIGFENYCSENKTTRTEAAKKLREEMKAFREELNTIRVNNIY